MFPNTVSRLSAPVKQNCPPTAPTVSRKENNLLYENPNPSATHTSQSKPQNILNQGTIHSVATSGQMNDNSVNLPYQGSLPVSGVLLQTDFQPNSWSQSYLSPSSQPQSYLIQTSQPQFDQYLASSYFQGDTNQTFNGYQLLPPQHPSANIWPNQNFSICFSGQNSPLYPVYQCGTQYPPQLVGYYSPQPILTPLGLPPSYPMAIQTKPSSEKVNSTKPPPKQRLSKNSKKKSCPQRTHLKEDP